MCGHSQTVYGRARPIWSFADGRSGVRTKANADILVETAIAGEIGVPVDAAGAIAAARANVANPLLVHGGLGSRPEAGADGFVVKPRLAANGRPGVWRVDRPMDARLDEQRDYETRRRRRSGAASTRTEATAGSSTTPTRKSS
jgi:hypothetical protein